MTQVKASFLDQNVNHS